MKALNNMIDALIKLKNLVYASRNNMFVDCGGIYVPFSLYKNRIEQKATIQFQQSVRRHNLRH